jgi:hypothetical protein
MRRRKGQHYKWRRADVIAFYDGETIPRGSGTTYDYRNGKRWEYEYKGKRTIYVFPEGITQTKIEDEITRLIAEHREEVDAERADVPAFETYAQRWLVDYEEEVEASLGVSAADYSSPRSAMTFPSSGLRDWSKRFLTPGAIGLFRKATGYAFVFLKLFYKLYGPVIAGVLQPFPGEKQLSTERTQQLDVLYRAVSEALENLVQAVGIWAA